MPLDNRYWKEVYPITIHSDTKDTQRISIFWVFFALRIIQLQTEVK